MGFNVGPVLQVGIRYLHGLTDVVEDQDLHTMTGDARNRCLQVYVGFGTGGMMTTTGKAAPAALMLTHSSNGR